MGNEYKLDISLARETAARLDPFTLAYVEALFFTLTDADGNPMDYLGLHDLDPQSLEKIKTECADFQRANAQLLEGSDPRAAGHDFLLTRDGHGVGFWDRDPSTYPKDPEGEALSAACHSEARKQWSSVHRESPGTDRAKIRSTSWPGMARAMAWQWGGDARGGAAR